MERKFASLDTTNKLLMLLVLPVLVFILKELSNIFVPLVIACFFALLFMPLLRWFDRKNLPRWMAIIVVFLIFFVVVRGCLWILQLASHEFRSTDPQTWQTIFGSLKDFVARLFTIVGLSEEMFVDNIQGTDLVTAVYENAASPFAQERALRKRRPPPRSRPSGSPPP